MFLYLKTGGGHLAPAKAVAEKIKTKRRVDVEILLMDGLSESNSFVKKVIEDGYKKAINRAAWTFEFLYALHKIKVISKFTASIVSHFVKSAIEKQILETRPKKIVVFHFFLIKPVYEIIKTNNLAIPVITVVTDPFTAHPIWFQQKGNMEYVCQGKMGILEKNTRFLPDVIHRLLTDNEFYNSLINNIKKLRSAMELDRFRTTY